MRKMSNEELKKQQEAIEEAEEEAKEKIDELTNENN